MNHTNLQRQVVFYFRECLGVDNLKYEMNKDPHTFLDDCDFALRLANSDFPQVGTVRSSSYEAISTIINGLANKAQKLWEKIGS